MLRDSKQDPGTERRDGADRDPQRFKDEKASQQQQQHAPAGAERRWIFYCRGRRFQ